jgi:DNA-directed RNA polymerase beta subunit
VCTIGTNAVVAVISHTGYDMGACVHAVRVVVVCMLAHTHSRVEDAMILCKTSFERGFAHGSVQTTEIVQVRFSLSTWFLFTALCACAEG